MNDPLKLVFIGGFGRSGSTLLGRMLGEVPGFSFVGELEYVWELGFTGKQPCGCGLSFTDCPFWRAVIEDAYGGFEQVGLDEILHLKHNVSRIRYIPQLALHDRLPTQLDGLAEYSETLARVYRTIGEVSGSRVIVDSSKVPPYAYTLAHVPGVELYVIQLVRDSRAVAYSWTRKKVKHETGGEKVYMDQHSAVNSSLGWTQANLLTEPLKYVVSSDRYMRVFYEDLVRQPGRVTGMILSLLDETDAELGFMRGRRVSLGHNHSLDGNPNRFEKGTVKLQPDNEWEKHMKRLDRYTVDSLTWPLLLRYGYSPDRSGE